MKKLVSVHAYRCALAWKLPIRSALYACAHNALLSAANDFLLYCYASFDHQVVFCTVLHTCSCRSGIQKWWLMACECSEMMQLAGNCIMNATASCSKHCSRKGTRKTVPEEALADHHQSVSAEPCGLWLPWNPQLSRCGGCRRMPGLRRPPRIGPAHAASSEALPCLND